MFSAKLKFNPYTYQTANVTRHSSAINYNFRIVPMRNGISFPASGWSHTEISAGMWGAGAGLCRPAELLDFFRIRGLAPGRSPIRRE